MLRKLSLGIHLLVVLCFTGSVYAALDPDADLIKLLTDCTGITDCTTSPNEMIDWVNVNRTDTQKQVRVDIGPGTFSMPASKLFCDGVANVAYRGAGPSVTVLTGGGTTGAAGGKYIMVMDGCNNLTFQDMTLRTESWLSPGTGIAAANVDWSGNGNSTWINVEFLAGSTPWYDHGGTHYLYNTKLIGRTSLNNSGVVGYYSVNGDTWFFGGEINAVHDNASTSLFAVGAVAGNGAIVRLFGTAVHTEATANAAKAGSFLGIGGVVAYGTGTMHVHGGIVQVKAFNDNVDQDVYGAAAGAAFLGQNGFLHMPGNAFALRKSGNGVATRIVNVAGAGTVESPFQWPAGSILPDIKSKTGMDTFVETDCDSTGNCDGPGTETHIMIYNDNCATDPWFDTTTGRCRGIIVP